MTADNTNSSILIVDDTPDNLRLFAGVLPTRGYRVRPVSNGEHAMVSIRKESPDLILLDIMMPGIDGYEVCRRLKKDKETASIPVIFIRALHETIDKVKAFSLGGDDSITKPLKSEEVLARVKTHSVGVRPLIYKFPALFSRYSISMATRRLALDPVFIFAIVSEWPQKGHVSKPYQTNE